MSNSIIYFVFTGKVLYNANVRVYDHLRCQSDSVSRYTNVPQMIMFAT